MTLEIERTTDAKLLSELNKEIQEFHVSQYPTIFKSYKQDGIEEAFAKMILNETTSAFLAKLGDHVAGYMILNHVEKPENAFQFARNSIYIDQIFVLEKHRKSGIAKQLILHAIEFAKRAKVGKVQLDHWSMNSEAKAFFTALGFENYREQMELTIGECTP